jgi:hypothetical protein
MCKIAVLELNRFRQQAASGYERKVLKSSRKKGIKFLP